MLLRRLPILVIFTLLLGKLYAQAPCTTLGQRPETAFPVCGTDTFSQGTVPFCGGVLMPSLCPNDYGLLTDKNPFWYKFTCFSSGKLAFFITPDSANEDYDWQLFDVTGHNPTDVFTDTSLFVACNWSGEKGLTGASDAYGGVSLVECAGVGVNLFSKMPDLIIGHNYLLLVSHFENTINGYGLSFGGVGSTAVITDTLPPHIFNANNASCDGTKILVRLNKRMKCNSLAADGSDFIINPPAALVTSATGLGCSNSFDMDSVVLTFNQPLPFGNYNLIVQNGSDVNTILDNCNNGVPVGETIPFTILSPLPVPMDSISSNKCFTDSLIVNFHDLVQCSSVAANGSDFFVTGTYPVNITSAVPLNCVNGLTKRIVIHLAATPLQVPGNFQLVLKVGTDGNTILSECDTPSVAGSSVPFMVAPKPVANFSFSSSVCLPNAIVLFTGHSTIADGSENAFSYNWNFDEPSSGGNNVATVLSPQHRYSAIGPYNVDLRVTSNKGCTKDTIIVLNSIHPQPKTAFGFNKPAICFGDDISITDSTNFMDGSPVQWTWNLGDATILHTQNVIHTYGTEQVFNVSLFSVNSHGCNSDTLTKPITVHPFPTVDAGHDRRVLEGGRLVLQPITTGANLQYLWTPPTYLNDQHIPDPKCTPLFDITYTIVVTAPGGCSDTDMVFVKVLKEPRIPNTFTPNNDGTNDFWNIQYLEDYPENHLQVFTRTGQLVFESRGVYKPWDGNYKGKSLPVDTYYYILEPGSGRDPVTGYITIIK